MTQLTEYGNINTLRCVNSSTNLDKMNKERRGRFMTSCSMMKGQKVRRFMTAYVMVLALFLATLLPEAMTVKAAEELVMKVHYHREDGNYDG